MCYLKVCIGDSLLCWGSVLGGCGLLGHIALCTIFTVSWSACRLWYMHCISYCFNIYWFCVPISNDLDLFSPTEGYWHPQLLTHTSFGQSVIQQSTSILYWCDTNSNIVTYETWVGDMTAGWEGGAAATFCLSLLKTKNWAKVNKLEASPEGVIVFQTCTGRSCCSCCLLDAWVLTLAYIIYTWVMKHDMRGKIILDRHHSFEPHIRNIRQMFCKTTDCSTVSSERLRHFRKELCQAEVAHCTGSKVTWLWFMWFHIWTMMMMILKMLQKLGL